MAKNILITVFVAALAAVAGRATAPAAPAAPAQTMAAHFSRPADGGTQFGEACRYLLRWYYAEGMGGPGWTGRACTYHGEGPALAGDVLRLACIADGGYFAIWPTDENGDRGGVCQAW